MFANSHSALAYLKDKAQKALVPADEASIVLTLISAAVQAIQQDLERLRRNDLEAINAKAIGGTNISKKV